LIVSSDRCREIALRRRDWIANLTAMRRQDLLHQRPAEKSALQPLELGAANGGCEPKRPLVFRPDAVCVDQLVIMKPYPETAREDRVPPSSRGVDFIGYLLCDSPNVEVALR